MTSQSHHMDVGLDSSQESESEPPHKIPRLDDEHLKWDVETVAVKLKQAGLDKVADNFLEKGIAGDALTLIEDKDFDPMGVTDWTEKLKLRKFIRTLKIPPFPLLGQKVFNDPVHGHIELHPLCVKIIDTPEFQRLRFIKQLGTCYFVYPGASHNRFEHSLGVCHLAGQLLRAIRQRQPELDITDVDVLYVEIAGLCHDLGHGPFSHFFDAFISIVSPKTNWKHEDTSKEMFKYLVKQNKLTAEFEKYDLTGDDLTFIEEMIDGSHCKDVRVGRTKDKSFLYEIVANKRNGIDVDKWDYFARDCLMLGIRNNFDYTRFIHFARVLEVHDEYQICTRDKDSETLYDMFHIRQTLHRIAYSHKTSNIIQKMVTDAFVGANKHIKFVGEKSPIPMQMSEAIDDMKAFSQMTDHIFNLILNSTEQDLEKSRDILTNVLKRKLYKCVGQTQAKENQMKKEEDKQQMIEEMFELMDSDEYEYVPLSSLDDHGIVLLFVDLDHGMNEKNPIENTMFYCKERPNEAFKIGREQESNFLPVLFKEQAIRVYSKADDQRSQKMIREAFVRWCEKHKYPTPKGGQAANRNIQQVNEAEQEQHQQRSSSTKIKQEQDMQ